jgi:hypothetical protein
MKIVKLVKRTNVLNLLLISVIVSSCSSKPDPLPNSAFGFYEPDKSKPWNSVNHPHINYVKFNSDSTFELSFHSGSYCDQVMKGKFKMSEAPELEKLEPLDLDYHYGDHWITKRWESEISRHHVLLQFDESDEGGDWNFNCVDQGIFHKVHEYTINPEALIVNTNENGGKTYFAIIEKYEGYLVTEKLN